MGVGLGPFAQFFPPISPDATAEEITAIYRENTTGLRIGLFLVLAGMSMFAPLYAAITAQMLRIEGRPAVWAYTQLGLGMGTIVLVIYPMMILQGIAFRPDRAIDPEVTRLINDLGWLPLIGAWVNVSLQNLSIAFATFQDRAERVFPRWYGYLNIWVAIVYFPATFIYFFTTGPIAWNGIAVYWLTVPVFGIWILVSLKVVWDAMRLDELGTGAMA